jgi:hypothetical protein
MRRHSIVMFFAIIFGGCSSKEIPELKFRLEVPRPTITKGRPLEARITLTNRTDQALLVCRENWSMPTGLIRLHVFQSNGSEVALRETEHYDYAVSEAEHLVTTRPGQSLIGTMSVDVRRSFALVDGEYDLQAEYSCPFDGTRGIEGRQVRVASENLRSNRIRIRLSPD